MFLRKGKREAKIYCWIFVENLSHACGMPLYTYRPTIYVYIHTCHILFFFWETCHIHIGRTSRLAHASMNLVCKLMGRWPKSPRRRFTLTFLVFAFHFFVITKHRDDLQLHYFWGPAAYMNKNVTLAKQAALALLPRYNPGRRLALNFSHISVVVDDSRLSRTHAFRSFQISQMINYFLGGKVMLY
jgi:hypothetical protein